MGKKNAPEFRFGFKSLTILRLTWGGGGEGVVGRNCYIWTIWVCDVVKGMTFKQFNLG